MMSMPDVAINWPCNAAKFEECNALIFDRHPHLLGAFRGVDGLNLPVQTSNDQDVENATYNKVGHGCGKTRGFWVTGLTGTGTVSYFGNPATPCTRATVLRVLTGI
jgi:hypothetical protein